MANIDTVPRRGPGAAGSSLPAELALLGPESSPLSERSRADQIGFARAFTFRMAAGWWRALTAKYHILQPLRELFPAVHLVHLTAREAALADAKGEEIASSTSELGAHQIGMIYTSLLPAEHRSRHG